MNKNFTFLSTFTGIGGFDIGFENAGMTCIGQCEIDKHANMVLRKQWSDVKRVDDVRKITRATFPVPDLICGGFPCQDLSVAGKRKGLAGDRSGLFFEFERIVSEFKPAWFVIENVPGLLSSNERRDFATVLRRLGECGYLQAYRVFDSQYFGVAQRRRRVFIVGSFGNGRCAKVLFESQSLPGDPAESRKAGKGSSADVSPCIASSVRGFERAGESRGQDPVVDVAFGGNRTSGPIDISTALNACGTASGRQDFETETFVVHARQDPCVSDKAFALDTSMQPSNAIVFNLRGRDGGAMPEIDDKASLRSSCGGSSKSYVCYFGVRRLTPRECERLQGFKDDWTRYGIDENSKDIEISDTQRYKMCGNAITTTVAKWIGRRIMMNSVKPHELSIT